jgi:hypothetical protein
VDHEFLRQLAAVAGGKSIQLVKHYHNHLRHAHADILTELDGAFLGIEDNILLGQDVQQGERAAITRAGNVATRQWRDGNLQDIGFVPRRASLGMEFGEPRPDSIPIVLRYGAAPGLQEVAFTVPLPRSSASSVRAAALRQVQGQELLGSGGISSTVQQRLAALRTATPGSIAFTSELSPNEAALVCRNGYRLLGMSRRVPCTMSAPHSSRRI